MTENVDNCTHEGIDNDIVPIIITSVFSSANADTSTSATPAGSNIDNRKNVYTWTKEDTAELISWRIRNKALFTGRRNAALRGFDEFIKLRGLTGKIDPIKVKRKWENLKQRYKELKSSTNGDGAGADETTAASWKWFTAMDEALRSLPCKSEPVLISASGHKVIITPAHPVLPVAHKKAHEVVIPAKRRKESELPGIIKSMLDREEERENIYFEREERRALEILEREDRKEKERLDREKRREKEQIDREERWERERKEWEERRDSEFREREERREREWIGRLERWEKERREWEEKKDRENREREERWYNGSLVREEKLLEVIKLIMEKK